MRLVLALLILATLMILHPTGDSGDVVKQVIWMIVLIVAAIVTPPDPISQITLAIPICLLYEISIWCVALIDLRRKREDAAAGVS